MRLGRRLLPIFAAAVPAFGACTPDGGAAGGGSGTVQIFVVPEETITEGLDPGDDPENVQDGWTIRYQRFLVTVGNFRARRSDTGDRIGDASVYVLDLENGPQNGYVVAELTDVAAVRWDKFGYDLPNAAPGAKGLPPTRPDDVAFMVEHGYSVYFEGTAEKDSDRIAFAWGFSSGTGFDDCATDDGLPGFAVPAGGTVQVKPTIHGDHPFFDNVTQGVEITRRRAGWLKACDADANGDLTRSELSGCDIARAMSSPPYDLSGVHDLDGDGLITVDDYVEAEVRTIGDYQGDGECPTRTPLP